MSDVRQDIGAALTGKLTPEQIKVLIDEVLAIKKKARVEFTCSKDCKRKQIHTAEINDARAVTSALVELANQAWGRPTETQPEEGVKVEYRVVVNADSEGV